MSPFTAPIRVRYYEADQMGIVHHSNYLPYFEEARVEYLRAIGHRDRLVAPGIDHQDIAARGALNRRQQRKIVTRPRAHGERRANHGAAGVEPRQSAHADHPVQRIPDQGRGQSGEARVKGNLFHSRIIAQGI